jgi:hypothetical protein
MYYHLVSVAAVLLLEFTGFRRILSYPIFRDIRIERSGGAEDDSCGKIDEGFFYHDSADNIDFEHLFKNILLYLSVDTFVFFLRIILITYS